MSVKATFDVTTKEGKKRVFNAQEGASVSLKSLESGQVIEADGILIYDDTIESYGKQQDVKITTLFGTDGNNYAGVSDTIARAAEKLMDYLEATGEQTFEFKIVKGTSSKGNEFLNLQLV